MAFRIAPGASSQVITIERDPPRTSAPQQTKTPSEGTSLRKAMQSQLSELFKTVHQLEPASEEDAARLTRYTDLYLEAKASNRPETLQLQSNLSHALAFLLLDWILPAIEKADDRADELIQTEDTLKEILSELVKPQDVDLFIDETEASDEKRKQLERSLKQIEQFFREQLQEIIALATQTDQQVIIANFNALKAELLKLNENRQQMADRVHERLDRLTEEIDLALKSFLSQMQEMEKLPDQMQEAETRQLLLAASLEDTLNKI